MWILLVALVAAQEPAEVPAAPSLSVPKTFNVVVRTEYICSGGMPKRDEPPLPLAADSWVLSRDMLDHLPAGRSATRALLAVPGVVPTGAGLSVGGVDTASVTWQIDGMDLLPRPGVQARPSLPPGLLPPR